MQKTFFAFIACLALCIPVLADRASADAPQPKATTLSPLDALFAQFAPYSCASDGSQRAALRSFTPSPGPTWLHGDESYIETYRGQLDCYSIGESYVKTIRHIESVLNGGSVNTLLIFAHGGLVPGASGFKGALDALNGFFPAPPGESLKAYPLFLIWHTGFGESLTGSWFGSNERQATAHGLLDRGAAFDTLNAERDIDGTSHNLDPVGDQWAILDPKADMNERETWFRTYNVVDFLHIWHFMIDEAEDTVNPDIKDSVSPVLIRTIAWFHHYKPKFRVVLVGHSAGAIVVSAFIEQYDRYIWSHRDLESPEDPMKFDVIFLAPAVSYMRFERALRTGRIANFRMFTMNDTCERRDHVTEMDPTPTSSPQPQSERLKRDLYPYSLLYFISGVLQIYPDYPLLGLARYLHTTPTGPYANNLLLKDVQTRLMAYKAPIVLAPTMTSPMPAGLSSGAYRHGDFARDPATLQSIVYFTNHELDETPPPGLRTIPPDTPPPNPVPLGAHGCYDLTSSTAQ